jgi:hypothetical protein
MTKHIKHVRQIMSTYELQYECIYDEFILHHSSRLTVHTPGGAGEVGLRVLRAQVGQKTDHIRTAILRQSAWDRL